MQIVVDAVRPGGGWHHSRLPRDWTALVLFRLDKHVAGRPDPLDGWLTALNVCQHVLRSVPGDALYLFAVGVVELLREAGVVVVNADGDWSPERLAAPTLPHRLERILIE